MTEKTLEERARFLLGHLSLDAGSSKPHIADRKRRAGEAHDVIRELLTERTRVRNLLTEAAVALDDDHQRFDSKRVGYAYCTACGGTWPCLGVRLRREFQPTQDTEEVGRG